MHTSATCQLINKSPKCDTVLEFSARMQIDKRMTLLKKQHSFEWESRCGMAQACFQTKITQSLIHMQLLRAKKPVKAQGKSCER